MPTSLSVRDDRRSRSKSPGGGRDRDRSHSRDTRAKSPPRREPYRPSKKYSESDSEEEERRYREKKSGKKYSESESEDDRYRKSSSRSKPYYEEKDDRRRVREIQPSRRRDDSDSESDRRKSKSTSTKGGRKKSDSDSDRRKSSKSKKSSKKKSESESESGSEDISISIHRKTKESGKSKKDTEESRRASYAPPSSAGYGYPPPPVGYPPDPRGPYTQTRHMSYAPPPDPRYPPPSDPRYAPPDHLLYGAAPDSRSQSVSSPVGPRYEEVQKYQYAQVDPSLSYKPKDDKQYIRTYNQNGQPQVMEIKPAGSTRSEERRDKKYNEDKYGSSHSGDLSKSMAGLAVGATLGAGLSASRHNSFSGGAPPASPLLEAYKGTYQSISPMPSALVLANHKYDSDISDIDMSDSDNDLKKKIKRLEKEKQMFEIEKREPRELRGGSISVNETIREDVSIMVVSPSSAMRQKKTVSFYDPIPDAKKIAAALQGTSSPPNTKVLIQILPGLSTDDLIALRAEYKNYARVGGQGINMAKHIKMRVTGNLGKVCYATALGRWESEAYWANSWYQGGASRRELLIESLIGRSNSDIREIKNCFKDKRYNDDLEKCMRAELKADKFRVAILLALQERRMPESAGLEIAQVERDVSELYKCLIGKEGGETAMIQIIVLRSDMHLRETLRVFELRYNRNFARDMISKSRNLVGETLAHILNGALNRPMRDALLLHQAIAETAPGKERAELLISRMVRLHWEPKHLERVKMEYERRYKVPLYTAIKRQVWDQMKTDEGRAWAEFVIELVHSSG